MSSEMIAHRGDIRGIVFSSGKSEHIAEALVQSMNQRFPNNPWEHWRTLFSGEGPILNQFLKQLLVIDAAVLLLTDDDIISIHPYADNSEKRGIVYERVGPRDNVVFEVGAIMSRVGLKRTFIVAPDLNEEKFRILDYLEQFECIRYRSSINTGPDIGAAMDQVADTVIRKLASIGDDIYHSDLPACGLCHGYFNNFLGMATWCLETPQKIAVEQGGEPDWEPRFGYAITLAIPHELMGQKEAHTLLEDQYKLKNLLLDNNKGRDLSVFVSEYKKGGPLHVIDIPTTLFTSKSVIQRVDRYWTEFGNDSTDDNFLQALTQRELLSFRRELENIVKVKLSSAPNIRIIGIDELPGILGPL